MSAPNISPLSLGQFTRDLWGLYDPLAISQLVRFSCDDNWQPKFAKAPDLASELFTPYGYVDFGLGITPGSWVYGLALPADPITLQPKPFTLQITDPSRLDEKGQPYKFWDEPVPSALIGNYCPTYLDLFKTQIGSTFALFNCPYQVEPNGNGVLSVEIWETSGSEQRIAVVLAIAENMNEVKRRGGNGRRS